MIRDPSDGSVQPSPRGYGSASREKFRSPHVGGMEVDNGASAKSAGRNKASHPAVHGDCGQSTSVESVIDTSTSGLPLTTAKESYLARLEESRKWLESYVRPTIND